MTTRRRMIALGAVGGLAALGRPAWGFAGSPAPAQARLETWLFNLKDDVSPERTEEIVATFREHAKSFAADGFMLGRNFIPNPFPARFEWICMVQFDAADATRSARAREGFAQAREEFAASWRNAVRCDLDRPLPAGYAEATGINVRHTVMFNFKPQATAQDRARNVEAIRAMGRLSMVQAYLVDRNPQFTGAPDQMEWQVIGDFASVADYRAYSQDSAHLALRDDFTAHTSRVAFLDTQP
jgi:hypothetical protein